MRMLFFAQRMLNGWNKRSTDYISVGNGVII